jgi:glycosyltransferase involved in cell wall biosynthesis
MKDPTEIDLPLISVVICTYNPRIEYLSQTLDSLQNQSLPLADWELILVDNNSSTSLKDSYLLNWHPNARWLHELKRGKLYALMKGISSSKAQLIITIDDDCLPDADYFETALSIHQSHPNLGAFGAGTILPLYERVPPHWFEEISGLLAIRKTNKAEISDAIREDNRPWGLGLCVTRIVAQAWLDWCINDCDQALVLCGRKATALEDDLFSIFAVWLGMSFGIFPELQISHIIPSSRLCMDYLTSMAYDNGYSHAQMAFFTNQSHLNSDRPASLKAALVLLMKLKPGLASIEMHRFITQLSDSKPRRQLRAAREQGWMKAVQDYRSRHCRSHEHSAMNIDQS